MFSSLVRHYQQTLQYYWNSQDILLRDRKVYQILWRTIPLYVVVSLETVFCRQSRMAVVVFDTVSNVYDMNKVMKRLCFVVLFGLGPCWL